MEAPNATLAPADFSRTAQSLYDHAVTLAGDSFEALMAQAKLRGLTWVEALEFVIVACLLAL